MSAKLLWQDFCYLISKRIVRIRCKTENLGQVFTRPPDKAGQSVCMAKKDTFKYELHDGHKTVYVGTTKDPSRREAEHRADGKDFTKMTIIGGPSTSEGAGKWEEKRIDTYKRNHSGDRPKYNQNDSGK